jgi:hypothetical protein
MGSFSEVGGRIREVRFCPANGHRRPGHSGPQSANNRHSIPRAATGVLAFQLRKMPLFFDMSTVGWEPPLFSLPLDKPRLFVRSPVSFVVRFCIRRGTAMPTLVDGECSMKLDTRTRSGDVPAAVDWTAQLFLMAMRFSTSSCILVCELVVRVALLCRSKRFAFEMAVFNRETKASNTPFPPFC